MTPATRRKTTPASTVRAGENRSETRATSTAAMTERVRAASRLICGDRGEA
jgi:hypothetical protein